MLSFSVQKTIICCQLSYRGGTRATWHQTLGTDVVVTAPSTWVGLTASPPSELGRAEECLLFTQFTSLIGLCCSNWMTTRMTNQRARGACLRFDPGHLRNSEKKQDVSNLQAGFCGFCGYIYLCFFKSNKPSALRCSI